MKAQLRQAGSPGAADGEQAPGQVDGVDSPVRAHCLRRRYGGSAGAAAGVENPLACHRTGHLDGGPSDRLPQRTRQHIEVITPSIEQLTYQGTHVPIVGNVPVTRR